MMLFCQFLIAGMLVSTVFVLMIKLMSWMNLSSSYKFFFLKIGLLLIVVAPFVAFLLPANTNVKFIPRTVTHFAQNFTHTNVPLNTAQVEPIRVFDYMLMVYFFVLFCLALRFAVQLYNIKQLLTVCERFSFSGVNVPIFLSSKIKAPFSIGVPTAAIILPEEIRTLTPDQMKMAIEHELIHIRRKDHIFKMFGQSLKLIWFFWPPMYLINRELEAEMEISCDAEVLGQSSISNRAYGELLIYFASKVSQIEGFGLGVSNSFLYRRILSMKTHQKKPKKVVQFALLTTLITISATISVYAMQSNASPLVSSVMGKQLTCKCDDKSTSTQHELNFIFSSENSARVMLTVNKEEESKAHCQPTEKDFTVSKLSGDKYQFKGTINCSNQKPSKVEMEIDFDATTMSLPHDICHKNTIFHCNWKS